MPSKAPAADLRLPLKEARRRFAACDICCVDLDQCVFPTFTQVALGSLIVGKTLITPRLWPRLGPLMAGGLYIIGARVRAMRGRRPSNEELMRNFSTVMSGVPLDVIESLARLLPSLSYPGWRDAMAIVSARMPTGLLSFSIQPIIDAYRETHGWRGRPIFDLASGTPIEIEGTPDGPVLIGCAKEQSELSAEAKLATLRSWMDACRATVPLVIGHGPDEATMADFARKCGGLSIGFRPFDDYTDRFDVTVDAMTWRPLTRLLRLLDSED